MQATFFIFAKRVNSTARPAGGTNLSITLKGDCSIINPMLVISGIADPTQYNYCYVPQFQRYYFISNWTWVAGLWQASCICDVLASYRTEIGASTDYIVRSSARYDGRIMDTMYPATTVPNVRKTPFETGFLKPTGADPGIYVLGIVSKNANSFGGVTYYALSSGNMRKLIRNMLTDVDFTGVSETEISAALEKVLFDPTEYIKSSVYIPYTASDILAHAPLVQTVDVGWWSFNISAWIVGGASGAMVDNRVVRLSLPQHPQASERGNYCNTAPYLTHELYYPPFGVIAMPSGAMCGATQLTITTQVEITTGKAVCRVTANNGATVSESTAQVGVPVQISRIALDPEFLRGNAIKTGVAAIYAGAKQFFSGGGAGDVLNGIAEGAQAVNATVTGTGTTGSVLPYYMDAYLLTTYYLIADDDNEHRGRPLCRKLRIDTIPGYIMVADPDIKLASTSAELDSVRNYMATGFYYE